MERPRVTLELSRDEALVFFEWISRFNESVLNNFEDQAEQRVLWNLECQLQKILVEPFAPNYGELLASARAAVRDPEE